MKLTRIPVFLCTFGRVEFYPAQPGWQVFWLRSGPGESLRRVGWITDGPTVKLARFFMRKSVAQDRGLDPYTFTDKNIDPP